MLVWVFMTEVAVRVRNANVFLNITVDIRSTYTSTYLKLQARSPICNGISVNRMHCCLQLFGSPTHGANYAEGVPVLTQRPYGRWEIMHFLARRQARE
jgi:hypothetical protein